VPLQISTLKFWINLEPLDYFHLIGMARGGRSGSPTAGPADSSVVIEIIEKLFFIPSFSLYKFIKDAPIIALSPVNLRTRFSSVYFKFN